jgi:hypothetical protein
VSKCGPRFENSADDVALYYNIYHSPLLLRKEEEDQDQEDDEEGGDGEQGSHWLIDVLVHTS